MQGLKIYRKKKMRKYDKLKLNPRERKKHWGKARNQRKAQGKVIEAKKGIRSEGWKPKRSLERFV